MLNFGMETSMEIIANLDEKQKLAFMKAFVHLAHADGELDENEKKFVMDIARIYGIGESYKDEFLKNYSDDDIVNEVKIIKNRRAALELIKEMCILAHADNELSDHETLLIGKIGQAMGVELSKIEQISNWIIDRVIWLEEAKLIFEKE